MDASWWIAHGARDPASRRRAKITARRGRSRCSRSRPSGSWSTGTSCSPVEGVYRLTSEVGNWPFPDSLHALLAARLDALNPGVRRLVADAAVLGATFPAEALIAVSGQDQP